MSKKYEELLKERQENGPLQDSWELRQRTAAGIDFLEDKIGFGKGLEFVEHRGDAAMGLFVPVYKGKGGTAGAEDPEATRTVSTLSNPVGADSLLAAASGPAPTPPSGNPDDDAARLMSIGSP